MTYISKDGNYFILYFLLYPVFQSSSKSHGNVGGMFSFTCSVSPNVSEDSTFVWYSPDNIRINSTETSLIIRNGIRTSMLSIPSVKPSHAGTYTCEVKSIKNGTRRASKDLIVKRK